MCLFTNKKKIKINIHQEIILSKINRNFDELNKNILSFINRKEKNTYTREYNLTHIIVGSIAILLSMASTVSSLMILGYLSKNESKNLFHEVMSQNFISIIIPIATFMFFIVMALIISIFRYEISIKDKKNLIPIKKECKIKRKLITLHILELILPLLIIYELIPLPRENIIEGIINHLTSLKITILFLLFLTYYLYILNSIKNKLDSCNYMLFAIYHTILFPVGILIYTGVVLEPNKMHDSIDSIVWVTYFLFIMISIYSNLYYLNHINKENKPSIFLYCLYYMLSVLMLSIPLSEKIDFTQNSLIALSIMDREDKPYLVNNYFVELHDLNKETYEKREIKKDKENHEIFYIICAKQLFKTDKTSLIEINKRKVQIPNELIHLDQHGSQCNSQNEEK